MSTVLIVTGKDSNELNADKPKKVHGNTKYPDLDDETRKKMAAQVH